MSLHQQLNDELKNALRGNDQSVKNYTRNIKSKLAEYCVANKIDRSALVEDQVVVTVVASYKKSLEKAIELLSSNKLGDNLIQEYKNEIQFCNKFLPNQNDLPEDILEVIGLAITYLNVNDIKQVGKVVGFVMKHFKDNNKTVDGAMVKNLATDELTKRGTNGS